MNPFGSMIVNLNIKGKRIVVVGGGNEAEKRINSLLNQECHITVISESTNMQIKKLYKAKKITLKEQKIADTEFISEMQPDLVITATDDKKINQKILNFAKKKKIVAYSSDNPEKSDFSNPAIIDIENIIQIAIFTGGKSPAMSKKIKEKAESALKKIITKEDIIQVEIQNRFRSIAKETISDHEQRKQCLRSIMNDNQIDQLIKDGQTKKAEERAITILRNWK